MKRMKAIVLFGCIALAAVIIFAGCATGGGATGGAALPDTATADTRAKKLAADLNAVKPGSAKVNGGTVTLSGWVGSKSGSPYPKALPLT
ncbi:MAG: hypothetical protein LBP37_00805 [Spirochaetaceae bacterium]|nr:hypothetical protein [Spirochaetaceae bacterium]